MTGEQGAKGAPHPSTDEWTQGQDVLGLGERERDAMLAWVGENLTLVLGRLYQQALDAYEAAVGHQARAGSGQAPDAAGAEDA